MQFYDQNTALWIEIMEDEHQTYFTIDGQKIPFESSGDKYLTLTNFKVEAKTPRELARTYIKEADEYKERERLRDCHYGKIQGDVDQWNEWRRKSPGIRPILYNTDLSKSKIPGGLEKANLANADLRGAKMQEQILAEANFHEANLGGADLSHANLTGANFCRTDLYETEMIDATLNNANLQGTQLAKTNFKNAKLIGCKVYGMSAWDLNLEGAEQRDLTIKHRQKSDGENGVGSNEGQITVDDLQVAQFVYLLLNNNSLRNVIDTVTSKTVLILGRFSDDRKKVLEEVRTVLLKKHNLVPIIFDFQPSENRDLTETVRLLASMCRFVIADLTDAKSIPQELAAIGVPPQIRAYSGGSPFLAKIKF